MTSSVYTYLIVHPPGCPHHAGYRRHGRLYTRYTSLKEAVAWLGTYRWRDSGHRLQRTRPHDRLGILRGLLADRNLGHLCIWYRWKHPSGWMINEEYDPDGQHGMQLLGGSFRDAVEMIQSGTLDRLFARI